MALPLVGAALGKIGAVADAADKVVDTVSGVANDGLAAGVSWLGDKAGKTADILDNIPLSGPAKGITTGTLREAFNNYKEAGEIRDEKRNANKLTGKDSSVPGNLLEVLEHILQTAWQGIKDAVGDAVSMNAVSKMSINNKLTKQFLMGEMESETSKNSELSAEYKKLQGDSTAWGMFNNLMDRGIDKISSGSVKDGESIIGVKDILSKAADVLPIPAPAKAAVKGVAKLLK